jgi:hypothetical protein
MRPGLIVRGECWIAPSVLDTTRRNDAIFVQMCRRNGIGVLLNGNPPPGTVIAYDEHRRSVTTCLAPSGGSGGWATAIHRGKVRALPGNL